MVVAGTKEMFLEMDSCSCKCIIFYDACPSQKCHVRLQFFTFDTNVESDLFRNIHAPTLENIFLLLTC